MSGGFFTKDKAHEQRAKVRSWPIATEGHVRRNIGDQGKSGLVVLNVSFVARDPFRKSSNLISCDAQRGLIQHVVGYGP